MNLLITGGAGFIGSHFLKQMVKRYPYDFFICFDKLTYAGNLENLSDIKDYKNFVFIKGDITNKLDVEQVFSKYKIDYVVNFAAESHVDNSIENPNIFYETNVLGVINLLNFSRKYNVIRFHQVSTDEVYGDLPLDSKDKFLETSKFNPSSPYSASKAAAELACLAFSRTYGMDITISRSVNNYGTNQNKEKLIPKVLDCIKNDKPIQLYGDGKNIRSWIDVDKNNYYIDLILRYSNGGQIFNIADNFEISNIDLVHRILKHFGKENYPIEFIKDRPGHDLKMSVDSTKIKDFVNDVEEGRI